MAPIFRPYSWSPWGTIIYTRSMKKKKKKKRRRRAVKDKEKRERGREREKREERKLANLNLRQWYGSSLNPAGARSYFSGQRVRIHP